jgi:uncharacterized protein YbjT (DUF2867 family)
MYVVTGATGNTGKVVAETLLDKGEKVRVLGRDVKRLTRFAGRGVEAMAVNMEDAAGLTQAFTGARGVYAMIPSDPANPNPRALQERVSDAVAVALEQSKVEYAVVLSSIGADKPSGTGPVVGLHNLEEKLSDISTLNALYLRAGYFMENLLPQVQVIQSFGMMAGPLRPDLKVPMIATRDIGQYAGNLLIKLDFTNKQTQELLGAADVSYAEAAAIVGRAIGKPGLTYRQFGPEMLKPAFTQMGMSAAMADLILEMSEALNSGYMAALEPRSPKNTTPTTLEQFVDEVFVPAFRAKSASA